MVSAMTCYCIYSVYITHMSWLALELDDISSDLFQMQILMHTYAYGKSSPCWRYCGSYSLTSPSCWGRMVLKIVSVKCVHMSICHLFNLIGEERVITVQHIFISQLWLMHISDIIFWRCWSSRKWVVAMKSNNTFTVLNYDETWIYWLVKSVWQDV